MSQIMRTTACQSHHAHACHHASAIQRLLLSKARDNLEPVGAYKGHKSMVGAHGGQGTNRARQGVTNRADNHAMGSCPLAEEGADTQRRWKGLASVTVGD